MLVEVLYCSLAVAVCMVFLDTYPNRSCLYGFGLVTCMVGFFLNGNTLFRGAVLFQGATVTCCEGIGMEGCVGNKNCGGGVSVSGRRQKSIRGSWENFSWDEPTEENGGLRTSTNIVYYYVT